MRELQRVKRRPSPGKLGIFRHTLRRMGQETFWKATGCCWEPDGLGQLRTRSGFGELCVTSIVPGDRAWLVSSPFVVFSRLKNLVNAVLF